MRLLAKFFLPLLAANLLPAQVNPRIWRLIGPDTKLVTGVDVNHFRQTALAKVPGAPSIPFGEAGQYLITIDERSQAEGQDPRSMTVIVGGTFPPGAEDMPEITRLDAATAIMGDATSIQAAVSRWNRDEPLSDLAVRARALSQSNDAWFLIRKPLNRPEFARSAPGKYAAEVAAVIEMLDGGVQFGADYRARVEITARNAEDAYSLAALGRWLPGLVQVMEPEGEFAHMVELVDNFVVQPSGRSISLSFSLSEEKLVERLRKKQRGGE